MKTLLFSLALIFSVISFSLAQSDETKESWNTKIYMTGDRGKFIYNKIDIDDATGKETPSFSIAHFVDGTTSWSGSIRAFLTSETEISFLNPEFKNLAANNLSLLSGKTVVVIATMRRVSNNGVGESSLVIDYCEKLQIVVIPDDVVKRGFF